MLSVAVSVLPNLIRAIALIVVYKTISMRLGTEGLVMFAMGSLIASISAALALGGAYNYLLMSARRDEVFDNKTWSVLVVLVFAGGVVSLICAYLFYIYGSGAYQNIGLHWVVFISIVSYIGFSLFALMNSRLLGRLDNKKYSIYGAFGSVLFLVFYISAFFAFDDLLIIYFGLLGYPVCVGLVSSFYLVRSREFEGFKFCVVCMQKPEIFRDFLIPSLPVFISSVALPVFLNGMISALESQGSEYAAGLVSGFRFTDMIGVFSGAVIGGWVFPRICGWEKSDKIKMFLMRSFFYVLVFSAPAFVFVGFFWDFLLGIFFTDSAYLPKSLIVFFLASELLRSSVSVLGYALIDARMLLVYFVVEFFFKVLLGLAAKYIVAQFGLSFLFYFYFVLAFCSTMIAFSSISLRRLQVV